MGKFFLTAAGCAAALFTMPASAAVVIDATDFNNPFTINYNGFDNPNGAGGTFTGLSASTTFLLTGISGSAFTFNYSVDNTSSSPVTGSRVSIFGFNTSPDILGASATGEFDNVGTNGNVPNLTGPNNLRVCFAAGGGGNCAGGGGNGVSFADANSDGTFTLNFSPGTTSFVLDQFYVRYQSLVTSEPNNGSATGLGTVAVVAVPEPATWALMMLGIGFVGGAMRLAKRRQKQTVSYA